MIRIFKQNDLDRTMQIWLDSNTRAHHFIPADYWRDNCEAVRGLLPQSELYVYEADGQIQGFIGLDGTYICGIFVWHEAQSQGIGRKLLDHVKARKSMLTLHVYQKNERAVRFYEREGFKIESENTDTDTGEKDFLMVWKQPHLASSNR